MKPLAYCAVALFASTAARADDIGDAKVAFATFVEYQKTDDIRALELFTKNCVVTSTYIATDGTTTKSRSLQGDEFRTILAKEIALKRGNEDVYESVKYTQDGSSVRVNAAVLFKKSDRRGSISMLYVRDEGALKIKELRVTVLLK
jgi:hypothetical protein